MNRRQFCRSAAAAGMAVAYPLSVLATEAKTNVNAISLDGRDMVLERAAIRELADRLTGPLLLASDPQYDDARRVWNGMHDKHPALMVQCLGSSDVRHSVDFARERRLLTAVRGGGHSWPGKSVCEGGLVIDLSRMNDVKVDPGTRRARVSGGALLSGMDTAALAHGLVTTAGVVSHTGVGGFTLGGGFGRLNRKYGLAVDNLMAADIVTADGRLRRISRDQEPDLFWAIRGGGGNFGVVTGFDFQLHPFDRKVLSGNIVWPIKQARDVLEFYAEWSPRLSDEVYVGPSLLHDPEAGDIVAMEVVYNGDPVEGEKQLAPLRKMGQPIVDGVVVQDYMVMQTAEDGLMAHGIRSYAKNGMVKEWTPALIDALIEGYDPRVFLASHTAGGAVGRVGELDTAFPHRNAQIMLVMVGGWVDPASDEGMISAVRAYHRALAPMMGGYYDNIDYDRDAARGNYGPAYARLSRIKGRYDPDNLFRLNSNIEPS